MPARKLSGRNMKAALFALASASAVLTGCTMEPKYERPANPTPESFPQGPSYAPPEAAQTPAADLAWRDFFVDAKLRSVIDLALRNNRNLRVALLNIEASRAQYHIQRSDLF